MKNKKPPARFRKQLKDQLPLLQAEGLITQDQANAISQRYRLDSLTAESTHTLLMVIYTIGVCLVGIGVISFVAAHWNAIAPEIKIVLIVTAMFAAHIAGFYLWKVSAKSPKLGHALTILGTLIFGANIGLVAQIFHIKENIYNGFAAWAIGATVMAYALQSTPNLFIAIVTSFIWFCGTCGWRSEPALWYPFAAAVVFIPFACIRRSAFAFIMTLLAVGISLVVCLTTGSGEFFGMITATLIIGIAYFSAGSTLSGISKLKSFTVPAMILACISTAFALYPCSFIELAEEMTSNAPDFFAGDTPLVITAAIALAVALLLLLFSIRKVLDQKPIMTMLIITFASFVLIMTAALGDSDVLVIVVANVLFMALAANILWAALQFEDRRLFWASVLMIALLLLSRTIEYETGLLIKSAAFTAGGIALIVAGVMFEKYLKKRKLTDE
jgi:uncharacterized membrane protein